jgi:MoxR-like ATPase
MKKTTNLSGWEMYDIAVANLRNVYVYGPPGIAKTYHSQEILDAHCKAHKMPIKQALMVTLNEDVAVQEIQGHWIPGEKWLFHQGDVIRAISGGSLVVNELARASGAVLDFFLAVMDGDRVFRMRTADGEEVTRHPQFKLVATANSGVEDLDPALRDRFDAVIEVLEPHPGTVEVLNTGFSGLGDLIKESYKDPGHALSVRQGFTLIKLLENKVEREVAGLIAFGRKWEGLSTALKLEAV